MPSSSDPISDEQRRARRPRWRGALAILAALAISAGAVACGGNDAGDDSGSGDDQALGKDKYLEQVNAAQTQFATDAAKLNLANPSSAKDFGNSLDQLDRLVEKLRKRLDGIAEPDAVSTEQDQLVEELRDYNAVIRSQKDDLTSGDPEKAKAAAQKVGKASTTFSQDFDATIRQINENLGLKTTTDGG